MTNCQKVHNFGFFCQGVSAFAEIPLAPASHQANVEEYYKNRHKDGTDKQHNVQEEKEYKIFTSGIAARHEKHKILSVERSDFIKSIFSLDDLEWSSLFLVGNRHPNLDGRMYNNFQRYLLFLWLSCLPCHREQFGHHPTSFR